jgi:hypothetical protein
MPRSKSEVRQYQALFQADAQPARLLRLRAVALQVMERAGRSALPDRPGAERHRRRARRHSPAAVRRQRQGSQIFLLNRNVNIDISETPHFKGPPRPGRDRQFPVASEGVHAEVV